MGFEEKGEDFTNHHVFSRIDNLLEHFLLSWPRAMLSKALGGDLGIIFVME